MVKLSFPVSPLSDLKTLYAKFNLPISSVDCGEKCRLNNPNGVPFCCDIHYAIPAVYPQEKAYFKTNTELWFDYQGAAIPDELDLPENLLFMQCLGASRCQREFRSLSCRQFPFYPYVTSDYRFLGLGLEWEFKDKCWIFENVRLVSPDYRYQFIQVYDEIFAFHQEIFDNYAEHSAIARKIHAGIGENLLLLHRNGRNYRLKTGNNLRMP